VNSFFLTSPLIQKTVTLIAVILVGLSGYYASTIWLKTQNTPPHSAVIKTINTQQSSKDQTSNYSQIASSHLFGQAPKKLLFQPKPKTIAAPETRLKLQLIGVIFDKDRENGLAIVSEQGKPQKTYRKGEKLPGDATLYAIEQGRIILERNSRHEALTLKKPEVNSNNTTPSTSLPALSRKTPSPRKSNDFKRKIKFM
jgi:general secretion pathway protein C